MSGANPTERPEERDSLEAIETRLAETQANLDEATARMLAQAERMDEMASQILELSAITHRAEQMEEALREVVNALVEIGDHAHDDFEHMGDVQRFAHEEARKGRAALSPSDTEEEA